MLIRELAAQEIVINSNVVFPGALTENEPQVVFADVFDTKYIEQGLLDIVVL